MPTPPPTPEDIERWFVARLAERLAMSPGEVDPTMAFADLGIDSIAAVEIAAQLQADWDLTLTETALWDYPTIRELAGHLAAGTAVAPQLG